METKCETVTNEPISTDEHNSPVTWRVVVVVSTTLLLLSDPAPTLGRQSPSAGSDPVSPSDSVAIEDDGPASAQLPLAVGVWGAASFSSGRVLGKIPDGRLDLIGIRFHRRLIPRGMERLAEHEAPTLTYTADLIPFAAVSIPKGTAPGGVSATQSVKETGLDVWGFGLYPLGFQVRFRPSATLRPFIAGHTGLFYFAEPVPDERGRQTNFAAGLGGGIQITVSRRTTLMLGYRYHHLSNGFRGSINPGLDANLLYVGFSLAP